MSQYKVAVVGATGAVGTVMLAKLSERGFPASRDRPLRVERSAGKELDGLRHDPARSTRRRSRASTSRSSAPAPRTSREWAHEVRRGRRGRHRQLVRLPPRPGDPAGGVRGQPGGARGHKGLIANPNCSTMQLMVALKPIHDAAGIDRLNVSTYQSVSGTGVKAVKELEDQTRAALARRGAAGPDDLPAPHRVQCAGRRRELPRGRRPHRRGAQDDVRDAQDPRRREHRDRRHLRARAGAQLALGVGRRSRRATDLSVEAARELLRGPPGLDPRRRPGTHGYPTALDRAGRDEVFVGRLRRDPTHERGLQLWVVSDNLLKGAATNAVQIAEVLHERSLVRVSTPA